MNDQNPSISIVTVCYNSAATIAETVQSVRDQTYSRLEHLIIDGNSKDTTVEIVKKVSQGSPHKTQIVSESDRGMYDAMRKGIAMATSDVVAILNSDDCLASNDTIANIAAAFSSDIEVLIGDVTMEDGTHPGRPVRFYSAANFRPQNLRRGIMPPHAGFYARRELFERLGSYDPSYRLAGDFELMIRFFLKYPCRFKHFPEVVARMKMGGASNQGIGSRIRLNQEVLRALNQHGFPSNWFKLLSKIPGKLLQYVIRPSRTRAGRS
ncbi:MAG: glycosyltransferase [Spirochaetia bacterium]|nr:glycosyltransferase [Spirochaetia bacterium]